ncbi:thioesterase family protein [Streptomyces sp. MBT53]|uniref:thioesterase family protein n=1 Tax=Streptomyces sp. MBT53 TaxID=1488384 RepID=UPI0019148171|nr:thioesterase family protein [Streptomyces sp. MBT53]MBK6011685.1 thioesterase family protein [Streptomyces sp. MBT53]
MSTHAHRVRNHEVDTQGFLFNSRYLELADVAMTEFFRELGWPYTKLVDGGTDPSVVSARQTFLSPARFDDVLDVEVTCPRVGTSSFQLDMLVARDGTKIAEIEVVYVNVDAEAARSRPLPEAVAQALRDSVAGEPSQPRGQTEMTRSSASKPAFGPANVKRFGPAEIEHRTAGSGLDRLGTYFMTFDEPGHSDPWTLQYEETVYVVSGRAEFFVVEDGVDVPLTGEADELIVLPRGTTVRYGAAPGTRLLLSITPVDWRNQA